jgi:hypothetical protein
LIRLSLAALLLLAGCATVPAPAPSLPPIPIAPVRKAAKARAIMAPAATAVMPALTVSINSEQINLSVPADPLRLIAGTRSAVVMFSAASFSVLESSSDLLTWNRVAQFETGDAGTFSVFIDAGALGRAAKTFYRLRAAQ